MIVGIGLDLVEMERIERLRLKQARFPHRILTDAEFDVCLIVRINEKLNFWLADSLRRKRTQKPEELVSAVNFFSRY